jgi:signal transduction histidine kinase
MREQTRNGAAIAIAGVCLALAVPALFASRSWRIAESDVGITQVGLLFAIGIGMLFAIAAWVGRGNAGETLRPMAIPLAVASATPLIGLPILFAFSLPTFVFALTLPTLALLLLADAFVDRIADQARRRLAAGLAVAAAIASTALTIATDAGVLRVDRSMRSASPWFWLEEALGVAVTLIPAAVLLATSARHESIAGSTDGGRSSERLPILLAAFTPMLVNSTYGYELFGLGLTIPMIWLLIAVVVLQTKVRFETLRIQRDMVVAATEIERARLAADLHDDALQEMTLLVRRLDGAGDKRSADLARSIADRLREVCGDLRLPILDELGAGPALEWLVARVGETSGRQVELERADAARPPADVELAVFRVAQEALANAVTHGAPPIVVRYAAASNRASLSITDRGAGIPTDAAVVANRSGHYGLLNMRQRAEQIGATFEVREPADGGTSIGLSWSSA